MSKHLKTPRRRVTALAAALVVLGLVAAALAASTASGSRTDKVTLRVGLFGDFGYHDLYTKYEATHPNIDIKEDIESYADHHSNLAKHLAVGSGADDIESVEVGFIAQFKSQPNLFVNLNKMGAKSLQKQWLDWKWRQSIAPNGAQIGLGTDVGSLAICYRRDLFKKAGLPTEPRGRLEALADLAEVRRRRQAVPEARAEGRLVLRLRQQRLQRDHRPAEPGVLRLARQGDRRQQPEGEAGLEADDAGRPGA